MSFESIAVIGMSCYFPGAKNYQEFWKNLTGDEIYYSQSANSTGSDAIDRAEKGLLPDAEKFNPSQFGISEKEAKLMDPQQRKFIELVDSALIDAGYPQGEGLNKVGVIASQGTNHTYHNELTKYVAGGHIEGPDALLESVNKGTDFLATRISYIYNFNGPSFNLQSACSSSLVALVEACYLLQTARCDVVICGGINISYPLESGYCFESGSIYSRTGTCRPFDKDADGTIPSNGGGVLILKRKQHALDDGDRIHGLIAAAGSNNDGNRKVSYAAPSSEGQFELLQDIYQQSGINPRELGFIECHATGTIVGDPIEVRSLQRLMLKYVNTGLPSVKLSSVKGEIGHLFWASGIASTIKSLLILKEKIIPSTKNLSSINPLLELGDNLTISNEKCSLNYQQSTYAAVSCFGVGGTNAHIILEKADVDSPISEEQLANYDGRKLSLIPTLNDCNNLKENTILFPKEATPTALSLVSLVLIYQQALDDDMLTSKSDYFDHFGDSITAVNIIADLQKSFSISVSQDDIFTHSTPSLLYEYIIQRTSDKNVKNGSISGGGMPTAEALNSFNKYQERFYLLEKLNRDKNGHYNVALSLDIDRHFPKDVFVDVLTDILGRIPLLSYKISLKSTGLVTEGRRKKLVEVSYHHLSSQDQIKDKVRIELNRKFSIDQGSICYLSFIDDQESHQEKLVISIHHLYIDGKGMDNLLKAVSLLMNDSKATIDEYISQNTTFSLSEESVDYWTSFTNNLPVTRLHFARETVPGIAPVAKCIRRDWSSLIRPLHVLARAHTTSPFIFVYSALFHYIAEVNNEQGPLCIGTTLINRKADSKTISCQINNIPVILPSVGGNIEETLHRTRSSLTDSLQYADASYTEIGQFLECRGQPLYHILMMFQNQNSGYYLNFDGRSFHESSERYEPLYSELCFNFTLSSNNMICEVTYDKNIYHTEVLNQFLANFELSIKNHFELGNEEVV